ncbi:Fic family protein [Agrobacterium tumefaciens]|uniref:Fic family protein n=1 Tax=Agrobacterium TaxID=357 RepID=UPI00115C8548|nr:MULTISPECIES: Fic family protein [Agrobacterium]MDA5241573.1 Fic family protein [Agrobacterium sp. MAFF310724]MDA5249343.1 Fic family protein [Agrobacterium sp. MAFF210268]MDO3445686.1 Fic family protein [Agrobacterium sp. V1]TRB13793.1 Fic family protein [Agrobacterium tumefaciens]UNZ54292.1 Fic family protein [Agrobacterium tumefaciens]
MEQGRGKPFSGAVGIFHGRWMPEAAIPVGYAALIDAFELPVPVPITLSAIGPRHKVYQAGGWNIYTPRHQPDNDLAGHLTFALRYEGLDLAVLKALFRATGPEPIANIVRASPTGAYARRLWFLYEWLLDIRLDLPDAAQGTYALVVDPDRQFAVGGASSTRHRVKNNLPGTPAFCPMIFRTLALDAFVARGLGDEARQLIAEVPADLLARTAAFLLLKDSRSSFQIEGEDPSQDRIQRWGQVIGEAGRRPIDRAELERLQRIVIGDARFVHLGLRVEGGFIGEHDRLSGAPIPDHISARHEDLTSLIDGLTSFDRSAAQHLDPVLAAAALAFGFVYIHPFEDGNGRLHRYLIHHVLAEHGFNPPGLVFPVSSVILDRIDAYRTVLESYSRRLLPLVHWQPTDRGNVEVLNDTADFYRYFDATPHAEFLFECVARTIDVDLPAETAFLRIYDAFKIEMKQMIDMPDRLLDLLFRFLRQNEGRLSKRARDKEFSALSDAEVARVETIYAEIRQSAG